MGLSTILVRLGAVLLCVRASTQSKGMQGKLGYLCWDKQSRLTAKPEERT